MTMTGSTRSLWAATVLVAGLAVPGAAHAALLFADDFNDESPTSVLSFVAFDQWTVEDGSADYIRSGAFGIDCLGGTGGCVDLHASRGNAGRLVSDSVWSFEPGVIYTLSIQVSGNRRGGAADSFTA